MALTSSALRNRLYSRARIRHLQLLVRVAELGSVKRAAEEVGLTQPAVTHALADLEALLECRLFFRHARGMRPTLVGAALLPLARRILATLDEGTDQVIGLTGNATSVVRVASITAGLSGLLVKALPQFSHEHPDVLVQVREADALQQADLVAREDLNMSICRAPNMAPQGWRFVPLLEDKFAVVCGPRHPLAKRRVVTMSDLCEATWLVAPTATAARQAFDRLFSTQPRMPQTNPVVTNTPSLIWSMLDRQDLLSILPASFFHQLIDAGSIVEISLDLALPFDPLGMLVPIADAGESTLRLADFLAAFSAQAASRTPGRRRRRT